MGGLADEDPIVVVGCWMEPAVPDAAALGRRAAFEGMLTAAGQDVPLDIWDPDTVQEAG